MQENGRFFQEEGGRGWESGIGIGVGTPGSHQIPPGWDGPHLVHVDLLEAGDVLDFGMDWILFLQEDVELGWTWIPEGTGGN